MKNFKKFLSDSLEEGTRINKYNSLAATLVGVSAHFSFYFIFKYVFNLPYENFYIRMVAVFLSIPAFILYRYQESFPVKIYWHIMLIYILPFVFTINLLKTNFHDLWLWWEIFMIFVLIMYVQNWFMVVIDLLLGFLFALLFYFLTPASSIPLDPHVNLFLYSIVLIFTVITSLIFAYANIKGAMAQQESKIFKSLAGSIAHELRNPLNSIALSASSLIDYVSSKSKTELLQLNKNEIISILHNEQKEISKHKEILDKTVKLANEVIDMTLLDLSGKPISKDDFQYLKSKEAIVEAMDIYGYKSNEERNKVGFKNLDNTFIFEASETAFKYIIFNLVKNALFYISQFPDSVITIGVEKGKKYKNKRYNVIYVKDTGPGIASENLEKIFGSFYTSGKKGGTGLGLDFCKRSMISFGGDIICESKFGEGKSGWTKFSLLFPVLNELEISEILEQQQDCKKSKILLVDDQEVNLKITKKHIEDTLPNISCDAVNNGFEAIELLKKNHDIYQLILLDIQMPEIDGIATASEIRKFNKKIPIVALTSLNYREFIAQMKLQVKSPKNILNNFNYYLNKSVPPHILYRAITKWTIEEDNLSYLGHKEDYVKALYGRKIILADDQEMNLIITRKKLEKHGLKIDAVSSGKELLELYKASINKKNKRSNYDMIITDINMPPFNGDDVTKEIRKIEKKHNMLHRNIIPIIALSGDGSDDDIYHFLEVQMTDYFIKGKDPEVLTKIVANYLKNIADNEYGPDFNKIDNRQSNETAPLPEEEIPYQEIHDITPLNLNKLQSLTQNDTDEIKKILDLFVTNSHDIMQNIKNNAKDTKILYLEIHALKGISGNIGAYELYEYSSQLCLIFKNKKFPKNKKWLEILESLYQKLIDQIKDML